MHYTIKMVRKGDGLVRDSTTGYFPDAETALADGSQYLIDLFPWDDDELDTNGRPKDWDFEVVPNPEAAAEEDGEVIEPVWEDWYRLERREIVKFLFGNTIASEFY